MYWTYKAISQSKLFDEIFISTDPKKINNMAQKIGYHSTGLRPSKLALDNSDQFRTHNYVFNKMKINDKNSLVCIVNNSPFITKNLRKLMIYLNQVTLILLQPMLLKYQLIFNIINKGI